MLKNATSLLPVPADVMGIPQTCRIWGFSTLTEQLAELQGSELEGVPAWPGSEEGRGVYVPSEPPAQLAFKPCPRLPQFPLWSSGCYSPMLICPLAEDPQKDNPYYHLSSFGHHDVAEHPRNKGEQRCQGFPLNTSTYSCLCLAV